MKRGLPPEPAVRKRQQAEVGTRAAPLFRRVFGSPLPDPPRHFGAFARRSAALRAAMHMLPFAKPFPGGGLCVVARGCAARRWRREVLADPGAKVDRRARRMIGKRKAEANPYPYLVVVRRGCHDPVERPALIAQVAASGPF